MVDRSIVGHLVKRVTATETGKSELQDLPYGGCPFTAVSPQMLQCADVIVHKDRHIMT